MTYHLLKFTCDIIVNIVIIEVAICCQFLLILIELMYILVIIGG